MELRHLRYFCAVADEMHVTRAAERLHLAQPALTQQIKALEGELQVELLRRVGRRIELTEAGIAFRREAEAILDRVRVASLIAQETARGQTGRLSIGLTESSGFVPAVTAILKQARERWPRVETSLIQARSGSLVTALIERRIDVAFVRPPAPPDAALQSWPFVSEAVVAVVPITHRLASQRSVTFSTLAREALIWPQARDGDGPLHTQIDAAFTQLGRAPRIAQETPEFVMAVNLVATGLGVSLVPQSIVGLRADAVVYLPLRSTPTFSIKIILLARTADASPTVANFLALAREYTAEHGDRPSPVSL
ncbi:hypothetical protein AC629_06985 [Bradyrhizobium sp. NAS80.1]|nr:hypothetical protein AC629_06985 [Bradyrhizobium sp. NAS80.1]